MSPPSTDRRARRQAAARRRDLLLRGGAAPAVLGQGATTTALHEERLDAVVELLVERGVRSVIDLGCGSGSLLRRLAGRERFTRVVGVDISPAALARARSALCADGHPPGARVSLTRGSLIGLQVPLAGFDAAVLLETIEHIEPADLSRLEQTVFGAGLPLVVLTTPNRDHNPRLGLGPGELRHEDHRFEWSRAELRRWAERVAARRGYRVQLQDIGPLDAECGSATQLAAFLAAG